MPQNPQSTDPSRSDNPSDNVVQRTRAWTGLWVVIGGDVAIAVAAVWGVVKIGGTAATNSPTVAILTSAFTAIGTMTTAYFGIKSMSNTAQSYAPPSTTPPAALTPPAAPTPPAGPPAPATDPTPPTTDPTPPTADPTPATEPSGEQSTVG
jgi:hypothetical protein